MVPPVWGHHCRRTIACPVSTLTCPVSSEQPVHWPTASIPRLVAERGPSTIVHSARASADTPTPLQLGSGGPAPGKVYELESEPGNGVTSGRLVLPSTMPPNPRPTANDRCDVRCQVGSSVPEKRRPSSPPAVDARAYCNDASSDQSPSSRMPSRKRNPSNRPLGAPCKPTRSPYETPSPIRKPGRRQASRSASVASESFGSGSMSSDVVAGGGFPGTIAARTSGGAGAATMGAPAGEAACA